MLKKLGLLQVAATHGQAALLRPQGSECSLRTQHRLRCTNPLSPRNHLGAGTLIIPILQMANQGSEGLWSSGRQTNGSPDVRALFSGTSAYVILHGKGALQM